MKISLQQAEKLLKGDQKFEHFAFSMALTHLRESYSKDPSQAVIENCTNATNAFLNKFQAAMADDISIIKNL